MPQGPYTRITIKRTSGRTEIIGRVGHVDPHLAQRQFASVGEVLSVRHETMPIKGKRQTVAIHPMKSVKAQ